MSAGRHSSGGLIVFSMVRCANTGANSGLLVHNTLQEDHLCSDHFVLRPGKLGRPDPVGVPLQWSSEGTASVEEFYRRIVSAAQRRARQSDGTRALRR